MSIKSFHFMYLLILIVFSLFLKAVDNPEIILQEADSFFNNKDFINALPLYQQILKMHPDNTDILKKVEKIEKKLKKKVLEQAGAQNIMNLITIGQNYIDANNYQQALLFFETAFEFDSISVPALEGYICSMYESGEKEKAWEIINSVRENDRSNLYILYYKGLYYQEKEQAQEAVKYYDLLLKKEELNNIRNYDRALMNMGKVFCKSGNFEMSQKVLEKGVISFPNDYKFPYAKAECYSAEMKYTEAAKWYEKSLIIYPDNKEAVFNMAISYLNAKQYKEANETFDKILQTDATSLQAIYYKGFLLNVYAKDYLKSVDYLTQFLAKKPKDVQALLYRGIDYIYLQDFSKALLDFNAVLLVEPGNKEAIEYKKQVEVLME